MPPRTQRVQPAASATSTRGGSRGGGRGSARAGSTTTRGGKTNGQVTTLPPIAGATAPPDEEGPLHENDIYNLYDQDGHRLKSPEPTTGWGRFKRKAGKWWRGTACYRKKKEYKKWREDRR